MIVSGNGNSTNDEQPKKEESPILVTEEGITTFSKEEHSMNVCSLISFTVCGISILFNAEPKEKEEPSMTSTEKGIEIDINDERCEKVDSLIIFIDARRMIFRSMNSQQSSLCQSILLNLESKFLSMKNNH